MKVWLAIVLDSGEIQEIVLCKTKELAERELDRLKGEYQGSNDFVTFAIEKVGVVEE